MRRKGAVGLLSRRPASRRILSALGKLTTIKNNPRERVGSIADPILRYVFQAGSTLIMGCCD
jgi:hypothetical protein